MFTLVYNPAVAPAAEQDRTAPEARASGVGLQSVLVKVTQPNASRSELRLPFWLGLCLFLGIALFFLWEEHEAHILGALPYLLLLACPVIHLLMHRGHGHGGHGHHDHGGEP